jgi:drug/metabolite transporter (DMT)-like permease
MQLRHTERSRGTLALILLALCYGLTAVVARYLSVRAGIFESWYLRYGLAAVFALALFRGHIRFRKFLSLPWREWIVLIGRSVTGCVVAVALYTLASETAKIGPVSFMQVLPSTTLLGVLLFKDKLGLKKGLLVALAFTGAAGVVVGSPHDLLSLNRGELYSLVSGVLFALVFVTRRLHTGVLGNREITFATLVIGAIGNYVLAVSTGAHELLPHAHWSAGLLFVLIAASFMGVAINFLMNYGFERVNAVMAGSILNLELVFGPIFGYVFYRETLNVREIIAGIVILAAVVCMNLVDRPAYAPADTAQVPVIAD